MSNVIKFPDMFSAAAGKVKTIDNESAARQCLKCALHAVKGELFGDPSFGSNIRKTMFEYNDVSIEDDIRQHIASVANKYAKGIRISRIHFDHSDTISSKINATIYYYLNNIGEEKSIVLEFS